MCKLTSLLLQQRRPVVFWALVLVVQVQRGRFVVVLWPRLFVVEVIRVARCDAGASCGLAYAAIFCVLVVVLWPRLRRVLRAVVLVGGIRCVLFAVVFYVVHVFCLPHCASQTPRWKSPPKRLTQNRSRAGPRMPRLP